MGQAQSVEQARQQEVLAKVGLASIVVCLGQLLSHEAHGNSELCCKPSTMHGFHAALTGEECQGFRARRVTAYSSRLAHGQFALQSSLHLQLAGPTPVAFSDPAWRDVFLAFGEPLASKPPADTEALLGPHCDSLCEFTHVNQRG
jgi:hypothetical protein